MIYTNLGDVNRIFKNDTYLAQMADKIKIGGLYKKYFVKENENKRIEQEASKFLKNIRGREEKLKIGPSIPLEKLLDIYR